MTINFGVEVCRDLGASARREWLETNGLGGFASATISGMNTRRYHGLLVAAIRPPTERFVLLSKLEETLVFEGERFELSTNQYPQTVHPQGYQLQANFRLAPFPVFSFRVRDVEIEKTLFMLHDANTVVVRYRFSGLAGRAASLELRPLVAFRDYHSLTHEKPLVRHGVAIETGHVRVDAPDNPTALFLAHDGARIQDEGYWYRNFEYDEERARGFDFHEDLFNPCTLIFELRDGVPVNIIGSTEQREASEADALENLERARRLKISVARTDRNGLETQQKHAAQSEDAIESNADDAYLNALRCAADQFLVRRGEDLQSIIAGYHWFTDWGRDTMISLAGLTLATRQFDIARRILLAFAQYLSEGMIPNRFPDKDEQPEYNTVDGTLWFVQAAGELLRRTGDEQFIRKHLYEQLREIIYWHEKGTRYGIGITEDGLLRAGVEGVQLTWMDAKVGDYVVTPRMGKAVEIQALWYNALRTLEEMSRSFGDMPAHYHYRSLADGARASFNGHFWNEAAGCLHDCINTDGTIDDSLRPNQVFAVSLPHPLVTGERARRIVETVERELLTPYGLRTLAPRHPDYRGRYEGDPYVRDTAYHQGTVWAWLIGPFITAYLKVHKRSPESIETARGWLKSFREHLFDAGLGQVSEIFDGDPPHTPRGCIAQAWSVAELLRCELEELS